MADLPTNAPLTPATLPRLPGPVPLSQKEVERWRKRLAASKDVLKPIIAKGKKNVERQRNTPLELTPTTDTVTVPLDFAYTEQKKASLFFQTPDIVGEALAPNYEPAVPIFTAVMNDKLGIRGVNAKAAMFEVLSDVLCPVGFGVMKVGYENVQDGTKPVPTGRMIPDPNAPPPVPQPGAVLGLTPPAPPPMIPETAEAPHFISETYYLRRIAPGRFRAPAEFRGSDFDDAAFVAWRFEEDVPEDQAGGYTPKEDDDELLLTQIPQTTGQARAKKRCGEEIWYKASLFDADAVHPDLIRTITLYDDEKTSGPPTRRDSPYQRWGLPPAAPGQSGPPPSATYVSGGALLGMKGFPLQVFTLHYVSDLAFPPSICTMSRQIVDEISKGRTQMIQRRDRSLPQVGYDATRVLPEHLEKIERGELNAFIGFTSGIDSGAFAEIPKGTFGRENFTFDEIGHRDLDQIWAMGSGGGVIQGEAAETATKSLQIRTAIDTRSEADRTRILESFVKVVNKLAGLVQIFADEEDYVRVVGPDGAKRLVAWNKDTIAGRFAFTAKPDSHVRVDAAQRRQQMLQAYNQLRKDPSCNPQYLITEVGLELGLDPQRLYVPPQPPKEEKPNVSWAIKIDDFIGPGAAVAVELARQVGVVISPQALQMAQTAGALMAVQQAAQQAQQAPGGNGGPVPHGGAAEQTSPINKHNEQITGGTPGMGVM